MYYKAPYRFIIHSWMVGLICLSGCTTSRDNSGDSLNENSRVGVWESDVQMTEWGPLVHRVAIHSEESSAYDMIFFPDDPAEVIWRYIGSYTVGEYGRIVFNLNAIDFEEHIVVAAKWDTHVDALWLDVGEEEVILKSSLSEWPRENDKGRRTNR